MKCFTIYADGSHRWRVFGQDKGKPPSVVDTNQVAVSVGGTTMLLDPGGMEIFPITLAALVHEVDMASIRHLFLSHQDPDVGSSLPLWRQVCGKDLKVHVPQIWTSYLAHFDVGTEFLEIPDKGRDVALDGTVTVRFLPAHYLHSSAAFCVYDPKARVLFSGDIGAAKVPEDQVHDIWIHNFASHRQYMEGFHQRYIGSADARDAWVEMISALPVDFMIPQHGLVFRRDDVARFLDWFGHLKVGTGVDAYPNRQGRRAGSGASRPATER